MDFIGERLFIHFTAFCEAIFLLTFFLFKYFIFFYPCFFLIISFDVHYSFASQFFLDFLVISGGWSRR